MRFLTGAGLLAVLAAGLLAPRHAHAQDFKVGDLTVRHPWTRATPGGAQVAGGYLIVVNRGTAPDRLTGGSLEAAQVFELHEMSMTGGVMAMRPTGPLAIPPGGSLTFTPSTKHIMFKGLKHGLTVGQDVAGTLAFEHAGTVDVRFTVEAIGAKAPADPKGRAGPTMPGMDMD